MAWTLRQRYVTTAGVSVALLLSAVLVPTREVVDNSVVALALACLVVAAGCCPTGWLGPRR